MKKLLLMAVIVLLLSGCGFEGDLFPDFPDVNVQIIVPNITSGEFTATFIPDGPYPEYKIKGYVEIEEGNSIRVNLWSVEIGGIYIVPEEK